MPDVDRSWPVRLRRLRVALFSDVHGNLAPLAAETPDEELERVLDGARDAVLAGGHTHLPLVRRHRGSLLVNPGSVGLPFRQGPGPVRIAGWAEYAIVEADGGRVAVELHRTGYDVEAHLQRAPGSGMPHADWWG